MDNKKNILTFTVDTEGITHIAKVFFANPTENQEYLEDMMTKWDIENSKREAVEEARAEVKAEVVKNGYQTGLSMDILSQISGFPIDKVKAILSI